MRDTKPVKETPDPQAFAVNSPEKSAASKKQRHQRRKYADAHTILPH